jgi:AcrR family transcriptional regulator
MPRLSKARKAIVTAAMRESIYEAAVSVLCKHGIDGTTMNRVAEAAQVTKSNLYNYFRSKDEILQFFNDRLIIPCFQAMEEVAKSDLPALEKLEEILRTAWIYAVQRKGLVRLIAEGGQDSQTRRTARPRALKMFTAVFKQGIEEGVFLEHNPENTARVLYGALLELLELVREGATEERINDYVEGLVRGVRHGFLVQSRGKR